MTNESVYHITNHVHSLLTTMTVLGLIQSTTTLAPSYTLLFLNCSRCRMMNNVPLFLVRLLRLYL